MVRIDPAAIVAFAQRLGTMPPIIKQKIAAVNQKTANDMARRGKVIIPRSSEAPHIADTIKVTAGDPRLMESVVEVGSAALYYMVPLEFGHVAPDGSHVAANPSWVPLTIQMRKLHKGRLRRAIRQALKVAFP